MTWWPLIFVFPLIVRTFPWANALGLTINVETLYYGIPQLAELFFDTLDHREVHTTQVSLWRLLKNPSLPLQSAWARRRIDEAEAIRLATCYITWPNDQVHVFIPFLYLLQHQLLAEAILAKRDAFGLEYYDIPLIDAPGPKILADSTSLTIVTSEKVLKKLLQPHLCKYRIWNTEKSRELLYFLKAPYAWDLYDWLYLAHSGAYSSTMVEQKALARLGSVFGRFIMHNRKMETYDETVCRLHSLEANDPELLQLGRMTENSQYYDKLVERIDRFTEEGTPRRTLWRVKLLLIALRILSQAHSSDKSSTQSLTSPGSPAYLVRSFLSTNDIDHLPYFYLNLLVEAISEAGIMENVLLYPQGRLAHTHLQDLFLENPLPLAPLSQCIWRWRQILWAQTGALRGTCNELQHQWYFYSYNHLLHWWSSYTNLAACLVMDPNIHIELVMPLTGPVLIKRLEKLLPHLVKAHRFVPYNRLLGGYLAGRQALARTIGTDILYRGKLGVPLPALRQASEETSKTEPTSWNDVLDFILTRLLDSVGFQQNIPYELLRPNPRRRLRLSE